MIRLVYFKYTIFMNILYVYILLNLFSKFKGLVKCTCGTHVF
jgi:hypothetical protein